jgi:hypothetical protein
MRKTNHQRRSKNLFKKIKNQEGLFERIYKEQEDLPEKKKSRLINLLRINEHSLIGNKETEIKALNNEFMRKNGI